MFTDVQKKLLLAKDTFVTIIEKNSLSVFRLIFAVYFLNMNITLLMNYKYLLGEESIPKSMFSHYYRSLTQQSIFNLNDSFFVFWMIINLLACLYLVIGHHKRIAMALCWIGMFFIFIRIPISRSIHIPFMGYMMMLYLFIPDPEKTKKWQIVYQDSFPKDVAICAWILIGWNYISAAIYKGVTIEWQTGKALYYIFQDIMPRQNIIRDFLLTNSELLVVLTYLVLLLEGLGFFLFFTPKNRKIFVLLSALFHVGILVTFRMGELSCGMLVFHAFLYASLPALIKNKKTIEETSLEESFG